MFVNIPSAKLKQLVKLSERKEALMAQIQEIDRHMLRLERQFGQAPGTGVPKGRLTFSTELPDKGASRRAKRGALKQKIIKALRAAGTRGETVRELSKKLGVRSANLYVWFNGTGRNVRGLKKIGAAKYRMLI